MVSVKGLVTKQQEQKQVANAQQSTLGVMIGQKSVQERFEKMLGEKAPAFLSSLLTITNQNKMLQKCHPQSILSAAAIAASLDLGINPSLGFAYIVPYGNTASFQCGYKGYIQMAQRSGLMKKIIACEVYRGEIKNFNRFTETFEVGERESDEIVGYYASFELTNGFKKSVYWTKEAVIAHAKKFSKSYNSQSSVWKSDEIAMSIKTVLSHLLRTYAPLSVQMQKAVEFDGQAVMPDSTGEAEVVLDAEFVTEDGKTVDVETGEIIFSADDVEEAVQG